MLRIKYEMDVRRVRQKEISARTGLAKQTVSKIVNGVEPPYPKRGQRIADALGWRGDWRELFEEVEVL
ncbi:MAG: helix-turn-helix transcriptional regulator [Coriobacteriia bacterium]|nr:helix-turn-helix transcriptional regulator [Coriobacteriia bacterium]